MSGFNVLLAADLAQASVVVLSLIAYLPQWTALIRSKDSSAHSLKAWLLWLTAALLALFYASVQLIVLGYGLALFLTDAIAVTFMLVTIGLIHSHRLQSVEEKTSLAVEENCLAVAGGRRRPHLRLVK